MNGNDTVSTETRTWKPPIGFDVEGRAEMIDRHHQGLADAMLRRLAP